ncbi:MAG: YheV family putative metal-binding protein [Pseudomonadota bacterium]
MSRPRFIAGAVCPSCGAMDRLQFIDASRSRRRCVACGHEDDLNSASSQAPKNRLDGALNSPDDTAQAQPVRILGVPAAKSSD